jgi:hypothetical protein
MPHLPILDSCAGTQHQVASGSTAERTGEDVGHLKLPACDLDRSPQAAAIKTSRNLRTPFRAYMVCFKFSPGQIVLISHASHMLQDISSHAQETWTEGQA